MATDFGKRLRLAREYAGLTQEQLAVRAGIAQSTLAAAEAKGAGSRKTPQLANACRVNAHWLATGEGSMLDVFDNPPKGGPPTSTPLEAPKAHDLSHSIGSDAPLLMSWEDIVKGEIREEFKLVVRDEAMTPEYMPGLEIVWSTRRLAKPGRLVLVRDKNHQVHIRQHVQGRDPGQWLAVPSNNAYATFDSVADGLVVLAVFKGRLEPDDL